MTAPSIWKTAEMESWCRGFDHASYVSVYGGKLCEEDYKIIGVGFFNMMEAFFKREEARQVAEADVTLPPINLHSIGPAH